MKSQCHGLAEAGLPPRRRRDIPVTVVTGGAGFVGTNLVEELLRRGERVRVVDNLSRTGVAKNLRWLQSQHNGRLQFAPLDVRDRASLRSAVEGATSVFHLAAQVAVTTSVADPGSDFDVNLGGTLALLEELRRLPRPPGIVFTSTNKVYGSLPDVALERVGNRWLPAERWLRDQGIDERRPLDFCTPYGCSKGAADLYVLDYAKTFGLPTAVFRMSCIYGPYQHGNEDQGWVAHFLLRAAAAAQVTIFGDGAQVRDILHVADLVRALLLVREQIGPLAGNAFNVGGGPRNTVSLLGLVDLIEELHGAKLRVVFMPERIGDQRWYVSNTSRLRAATGWEPSVSPESGVTALYNWLSARMPARTQTTV